MTAYKSGGKVSLISRNGRDHTQRFAGIAEAIWLIPESTLTLDGEVAISVKPEGLVVETGRGG